MTDFDAAMLAIGARARVASTAIAQASHQQRTAALISAAREIRLGVDAILRANEQDIQHTAQADLSTRFVDRMTLSAAGIAEVADQVSAVAEIQDPVGSEIACWTRPNGLKIRRIRVPLGVVGVIFESRPNVAADAGSLCIRAGNAAILRSGSESWRSSAAFIQCLQRGLVDSGLPPDGVQMVPSQDRAAVGCMLRMTEHIDVIVPRGGPSLTKRVMNEAKVPVIGHFEGVCHVYVHESADPAVALSVVLNSKMRRTSICGAAETLLIDSIGVETTLPPILRALRSAACGVVGDSKARSLDSSLQAATELDWSTEYLGPKISVRCVDGLDAAIAHIARYGSHHTDAIIASDEAALRRFTAKVDSAIVLTNASTQFADGGEFGMGAEIGISTSRLHARGPVGAEQLTTYKYIVEGSGQVRS